MISVLMMCRSVYDQCLAADNGYTFFSALSRAFPEPLFHEAEPKVICSPLLPVSFWQNNAVWTGCKNEFAKGALAVARLCFVDDTDYKLFSSTVIGKELSVSGAGFRVESFSNPGNNKYSRYGSFDSIQTLQPAGKVKLNFITPCGFKKSGSPFVLPDPTLFFRSVAARLEKIVETEFFLPEFSDVTVESVDIKSHVLLLKNRLQIHGFAGSATYNFSAYQKLERLALTQLCELSFFLGSGYKTSQGMGQVIPEYF